jgi:hypothetical protein
MDHAAIELLACAPVELRERLGEVFATMPIQLGAQR